MDLNASINATLLEKPPHSRLPLLDLGIDWSPVWSEFTSSLRDTFTGPKPETDEPISGGPDLRVEWVCARRADWSFVAAIFLHIAFIWLAVLPIWGWLPQPSNTLAPVQIEVTWYTPQDLHEILLPAKQPHVSYAAPSHPDPSPKVEKPAEDQRGADAFHPRQTILSVPVKLTHPRQTLIQPSATADAPKIVPQLPNMVEWAPAQPKLQLQFSVSKAAPAARQRHIQDAAAPDVAALARNSGPVDIAPAQDPALRMPIAPMSAAVARSRTTRQQDAQAPDIASQASQPLAIASASQPDLKMPNAPSSAALARTRAPRQQEAAAPVIDAASAGNAGDLRRIVALSAMPAPPAPEVRVPQGNLAANVSISPDGAKSGAPDGAAHASTSSKSAISAGSSGSGSLPAAIEVRGGGTQQQSSAGRLSASNLPATPNARAMIPAPSAPGVAATNGAANIASLAPGAAPEQILAGKEIGTLHMNTPNVSSTRGSWIMHFAQLDEDPRPMYRPKGELAGPLPVQTVDPRYPPDTIKEHIYGEVVLYAIIRKDGSIDSIQIVESLDPRLDKSAIDALSRWKFNPGTRAGTPVDLEAVIHVPFEYRETY